VWLERVRPLYDNVGSVILMLVLSYAKELRCRLEEESDTTEA
jgi:hypothetical protein